MKLRSLIFATTIFAAGTGLAFAQSAPSPNNESGPGVSATTPSPTDQGAGGASGNTKGIPERSSARPMSPAGTTGSGMTSPRGETQQKNKSPASQDDTIDKVK